MYFVSLMRLPGLEPGTSTLSVLRSNQLSYRRVFLSLFEEHGGKEIRTPDPLLAKQMLYQLSYAPLNMLHNLRCKAY